MAEEFDEPENLDQPPSFFPTELSGDMGRLDPSLGDPVEVSIWGVFASDTGGQISRFVMLGSGSRQVPIMIGPYEAAAISLPLEGSPPDRPMTHDLIRAILCTLEVTLAKVVIDDLWNGIYYAKLFLQSKGQEFTVDSRPSDAIALAVRFEAPIFVAEGILESVGED